MKCCYVLNCDKSCNFDPTRSMFTIPKNADLYEKWCKVIPQTRRKLVQTDRICSRHFRKADIETHWIHTIEGTKVEMPRTRPQLKKDAVPCVLLRIEHDVKSRLKPKEENKVDELVVVDAQCQLVDTPSTKKRKVETPEVLKERKSEFQVLYEEIFDVTLPSLLWGIHRDPDEKFAAFSRLNVKTYATDLVVVLDETCSYYVRYKGKELRKGKFTATLDCEVISKLLDDMNEICL